MLPTAKRTLSGGIVIFVSLFLLERLWCGATGWSAAGIAALFAGFYLCFDYAFGRQVGPDPKRRPSRAVVWLATVAVVVVAGVYVYVNLSSVPDGFKSAGMVRVGGFLAAVLYDFVVPESLFR